MELSQNIIKDYIKFAKIILLKQETKKKYLAQEFTRYQKSIHNKINKIIIGKSISETQEIREQYIAKFKGNKESIRYKTELNYLDSIIEYHTKYNKIVNN